MRKIRAKLLREQAIGFHYKLRTTNKNVKFKNIYRILKRCHNRHIKITA